MGGFGGCSLWMFRRISGADGKTAYRMLGILDVIDEPCYASRSVCISEIDPGMVGDVFPNITYPDDYLLAIVEVDNMICRPCSSWYLWVPQRNEFKLLQTGEARGGAAVCTIA